MNNSTDIKLRWLNPISLPHYDEPMGGMIKSIVFPNTKVEVVSLDNPIKMDNLEYRYYESLIWGDIVRVAYDADTSDVDAMVIGCFYDPALEDCREICQNTIIVAPCQASMQVAANVANKFSVIVGQVKWIEQMTERTHRYGFQNYLASMRSVDIAANALQCDTEYTIKRIIEEGRKAMEEDHAEALILGCTCNFGLAEKVQEILGIPVIDPMIAAVKMAENLAILKHSFGLKPSNKWSSQAPPEEEMVKFSLDKYPAPIGNQLMF
jgi:allantoin racemase